MDVKLVRIAGLLLIEQSDRTGSCWLWEGRILNSGYGHTYVSALREQYPKGILIHRLAWLMFRGDIPKGLNVLHTCDIRNCWRPKHLFLGTQVDNAIDMILKGRDGVTGVKNWQAKLGRENVKSIRLLYATNTISQRELAKRYGVSKGAIQQVVEGKSWIEV